MKLTRNAYKRKIMLFGVLIFASIALISTGFAAWVMSSDATEEPTGNLSVGLVADSSLTINLSNKTEFEAFKYRFEPKESDLTGRVRYNGEEADAKEALTFTVNGTIGNYQILATNGFTVTMDLPQGVKEAAAANLIVLPECATSPQTITVDLTDGSFSYEIKFAWGTAFNSMNPGEFYDRGNVANPTHEDYISDADAKKTLENLRAYIYGYYSDLNAPNADRAAIIESHKQDTMPTFKVTFTAKAN